MILFVIILIILFIEIIIFLFVKELKKSFKWIITSKDELPIFSKNKFDIFLEESYSADLGWDRKPGTKGVEDNKGIKTYFEITQEGYRKSTNKFDNSKIATFGDSYTFCRYVSDDKTWQHYLENLCKTHVRNFGVGNYGLDQAFLKFEKTELDSENKIIIFSIVPETISRIHSYWKHYLEFGNIFSFKPRFKLDENNEITKVDNFLTNNKDIEKIYGNIDKVKMHDFFYKEKFIKRMFKFPYSISFLKFFKLNTKIFYYLINDLLLKKIFKDNLNKKFYYKALEQIIIKNIVDSNDYYLIDDMNLLLRKMIFKYDQIINTLDKKMIILIIPQKYDLLVLKKNYYSNFFKNMSDKVEVIDLTESFTNHKDINSLYIDDKYAGHLSERGNKLVSDEIFKYLDRNSIKW